MNMETLAIDSVGLFSSCPEHISSFLEDFQDKNSHLFPSSDLTFSPVELELNPYRIVGHKRKLDLSYDTFSSWTEDLLDPSELAAEADSLVDQISAGSPTQSETTETQISLESSSNSQNCEHVDKKIKLSDDEDFALYQTDARSRSPPGYSLMADDEVDVQPLSLPQALESVPLVNCKQTTTPSPLHELRNTLLQMDPDTCSALKDSFARLAANTRNGNSPFSVAPQTTMAGKIYLAQDLLTLQLLYGNMNVSTLPVSAPVKPERQMTSTVSPSSYYPVAPAGMAYPYMMNSSYTVYPAHPSVPMNSHIMPETNTKCSMPADMQMYNGTSMVSGKSLFSAACSKNMFYTPAPKKFAAPQTFASPTLIPQQPMYACQPIHVL